MKRKPGVGNRIRERLQAIGYEKNGRPDVLRFCDERRYNHVYVYQWMKDAIPQWENLDRLANDLGVSPEWLLFGDVIYERNVPAKAAGRRSRKPVPIKGGSGALLPESPSPSVPGSGEAPAVRGSTGHNQTEVPLIRSLRVRALRLRGGRLIGPHLPWWFMQKAA